MPNNFYSSSKHPESQLKSNGHCSWKTIGCGMCLALTLVMVAPVAADVQIVYKSSYSTNVIGKLRNWWSSLWKSSAKKRSTMIKRFSKSLEPGALMVPFLEATEREVKLRAGQSVLHFWLKEGEPPYRIFVEKGDRLIGWTESSNDETEMSLKLEEPLKVGNSYNVTISDAAPGAYPVIRNLRVVADNELPRPTREQRREIQNSQEQHLSCVQWLTEQQQGVWAFEAYQFLMGGGTDERILSVCGIN